MKKLIFVLIIVFSFNMSFAAFSFEEDEYLNLGFIKYSCTNGGGGPGPNSYSSSEACTFSILFVKYACSDTYSNFSGIESVDKKCSINLFNKELKSFNPPSFLLLTSPDGKFLTKLNGGSISGHYRFVEMMYRYYTILTIFILCIISIFIYKKIKKFRNTKSINKTYIQ